MKTGILGGTFDPVHNAHLALAQAALEQLRLDRVFLVLSPRSPFKLDRDLTPAPQRFDMLKAAIEGKKGLFVGDWELKRRGPSYTVTTLEAFKKKNPKDKLFLILGSDALEGFDKWKAPEKILKTASLVVGRRSGSAFALGDLEGNLFFLKGEFPDISSTRIRKDVKAKNRASGLPLAVETYIHKHGLYGFKRPLLEA